MKNLYCIYDKLAKACGPIVAMAGDPAAVRMFGDVASDPQTNVHRHLGDHELIQLGVLDEESGCILAASGEWRTVVITGEQWRNAQAPAEPQLALEA